MLFEVYLISLSKHQNYILITNQQEKTQLDYYTMRTDSKDTLNFIIQSASKWFRIPPSVMGGGVLFHVCPVGHSDPYKVGKAGAAAIFLVYWRQYDARPSWGLWYIWITEQH